MKIDLKITASPLDPAACTAFAAGPSSGGTALFIGTVRDATHGKRVVHLEFEAYESMALRELQKIAERAFENWPIHALAIHHRTGVLAIGEAAVVIAAGAAHRDAAFDACRFAIDELKKTVPIWKKEVFEDGEIWSRRTRDWMMDNRIAHHPATIKSVLPAPRPRRRGPKQRSTAAPRRG